MRRVVIALAVIGLGAAFFGTLMAGTEPERVEVGDVSYSQDDIEMSECILAGGKAYFAPKYGTGEYTLSKYIGCNVHPNVLLNIPNK